MKTNANMVRKMGDFDVIQRTKDGMFNATVLLKQWNEMFPGAKKQVKDFLRLDKTVEFVEVLVMENNPKSTLSDCYVGGETIPNKVINVYEKSRGANGGTWMHPFLFIDFAMWLNPKFKYKVIKFVYDELIKHRHLAGDNYIKLCASISKFPGANYGELGKILNYVVFNTHEKAIRNAATPEQENDLQQLERDMCKFIEMGFIRTWEQLKDALRKEWRRRHKKVPVVLM